MKVLFLQDDFPPQSFGGAGISVYELALGMQKAGHDVIVITTCRKEHEAGESDYHGIKVFRIASDYHERWRAYVSLYNRPVVREVERLLQKIRPDVVHVNNVHFYLSYYCLKIASRYAKTVVFTARDVMTFNFAKLGTKRYLESLDCRSTWRDHVKQAEKRWNPFRNFFIRRCLRYADKITAVSGALRKALLQNGIRNVEVVHTGVDVEVWRASSDKLARFRKHHELENKRVIMFSGRLSEAKGGEVAIEALMLVSRAMPSAMLLVVGSIDWYARQMEEKARRLGVGNKLIFAGWMERKEIKTAYAAADVVVVPSLYLDPFPRVVFEAMVSKKPVVGTCYGGTPEIVVDGVTGYIVNPLYPEEIAEKTSDLLTNPQKAERFGTAGYERVRSEFSLKKSVSEYLDRFAEIH